MLSYTVCVIEPNVCCLGCQIGSCLYLLPVVSICVLFVVHVFAVCCVHVHAVSGSCTVLYMLTAGTPLRMLSVILAYAVWVPVRMMSMVHVYAVWESMCTLSVVYVYAVYRYLCVYAVFGSCECFMSLYLCIMHMLAVVMCMLSASVSAYAVCGSCV
jgi:hypothetical protein